MDIQAVAQQVMGYLGSNPDLIAQFIEHPYSTTAAATGSDAKISKTDMSQIVTQVAAQTNNQNVASGELAGIAQALLGQTDGSVHGLTSALFGGATKTAGTASKAAGPSMAEIAAKSVAGGLAARGMASLITSALGTDKAEAASKDAASAPAAQMPDLSGLAKLAEGLLGKK